MPTLTRKQAVDLAGVAASTITYWAKRGLLPAARSGLAHATTPEDLLAAQRRAHVGDVIPRWRADPGWAGQRLWRLRDVAGVTQVALAARSGISHDVIPLLEHGKRAPQAPTVHQLSATRGIALERPVDDPSIGLETLSTAEAARRLDVPVARLQTWLQQDVLPGRKVGGRWRIPVLAVDELDRSGRLRGNSRRLDG